MQYEHKVTPVTSSSTTIVPSAVINDRKTFVIACIEHYFQLNNLNCPVSLSWPIHPVLLSCGHHICNSVESKIEGVCPVCRAVYHGKELVDSEEWSLFTKQLLGTVIQRQKDFMENTNFEVVDIRKAIGHRYFLHLKPHVQKALLSCFPKHHVETVQVNDSLVVKERKRLIKLFIKYAADHSYPGLLYGEYIRKRLTKRFSEEKYVCSKLQVVFHTAVELEQFTDNILSKQDIFRIDDMSECNSTRDMRISLKYTLQKSANTHITLHLQWKTNLCQNFSANLHMYSFSECAYGSRQTYFEEALEFCTKQCRLINGFILNSGIDENCFQELKLLIKDNWGVSNVLVGLCVDKEDSLVLQLPCKCQVPAEKCEYFHFELHSLGLPVGVCCSACGISHVFAH